MKISIVATLYRSAPFIESFYARVTETVKRLTGDYEIILVNDGSPDNSLSIALALAREDKHLVVVDLSRNFGHHKAVVTGLTYAKGERIFLIDSDLEEEPEWLASFTDEMNKSGADMVFGVQSSRKGGWFERVSGECFYSLFRIMTGIALPRNLLTVRLMSRRYLDALLEFQEREIFLGGLMELTGFEQRAIPVKKGDRGERTYTVFHSLALFTNSITSFSNAPLVMIFYVGLLIFLLASMATLYVVANWAFWGRPVMGWTSVIVSVWLLGGLIISFIGIVGIYLAKVFSETKRRPLTIVRQVYGR